MTNTVHVDLAYENFLSTLFGHKNYHGYTGEKSFAIWQKDLVRVANALRRSIELTVPTDLQHHDDLIRACELAIKAIKSATCAQEASNAAIRYLTQIAFLLIGEIPDHYHESAPTHDKHWVLNSSRQIGYAQSAHHKAHILLQMARRGSLGPGIDSTALEIKHHELDGNSWEFLRWVKEVHPEAYLRCF